MDTAALLGDEASSLLDHKATAFPKEWLTLPGPNYLQDVFTQTDRSPTVLRNLGALYNHGRLAGTGYLSILPVDRELSTQRPRASRRILSTSIQLESVTLPSQRTATPWRRPLEHSASCLDDTSTASHSL